MRYSPNKTWYRSFETLVFSQPINLQTDIYEKIVIDAFSKFVPVKTIHIRPNDQPWSNSYTRLLLRKKNRNYSLYKKINLEYDLVSSQGDIGPEILTRYLTKRNKAYNKSREAANKSNVANRRAKYAFYNSVNSTMNDCNISAKKKFSILLKLMKNNKFSGMSPLNENGVVYNDPKEKGQTIFLHLNLGFMDLQKTLQVWKNWTMLNFCQSWTLRP